MFDINSLCKHKCSGAPIMKFIVEKKVVGKIENHKRIKKASSWNIQNYL